MSCGDDVGDDPEVVTIKKAETCLPLKSRFLGDHIESLKKELEKERRAHFYLRGRVTPPVFPLRSCLANIPLWRDVA